MTDLLARARNAAKAVYLVTDRSAADAISQQILDLVAEVERRQAMTPPTAAEVLTHLAGGGQIAVWEVIDWEEWEDDPTTSQRWLTLHRDFSDLVAAVLSDVPPSPPQPGVRLLP